MFYGRSSEKVLSLAQNPANFTLKKVFKDLCQNVFKTNFEENHLAAKDALEKCID